MIIETKIREYAEGMGVELRFGELDSPYLPFACPQENTWYVEAYNEAGYNATQVDLIDLLKYVKTNLPDVWGSI